MHAQEHSKNFRNLILYSGFTLIRVLHRSIIKGVSSLAFITNNHAAQSIWFNFNQKLTPCTNNTRNCNSPTRYKIMRRALTPGWKTCITPCPGFDSSILRHSGIWGAEDEAVLNNVQKGKKKSKNEKIPLFNSLNSYKKHSNAWKEAWESSFMIRFRSEVKKLSLINSVFNFLFIMPYFYA